LRSSWLPSASLFSRSKYSAADCDFVLLTEQTSPKGLIAYHILPTPNIKHLTHLTLPCPLPLQSTLSSCLPVLNIHTTTPRLPFPSTHPKSQHTISLMLAILVILPVSRTCTATYQSRLPKLLRASPHLASLLTSHLVLRAAMLEALATTIPPLHLLPALIFLSTWVIGCTDPSTQFHLTAV